MSQKKIEYLKFSEGGRCTFEGCRERKYTLQDGFQYCRRGHRQEGFTQRQADEDDEYKSRITGRTARKARDLEAEKEARARRVLKGARGLEMYMHCLQLVLRKMVRGLEDKLGRERPAGGGELEHVAFALWNIRVRAVKHLEDAKRREARSGGDSAGESGFYSSMSERDSGTEIDGASSVSSVRSGRRIERRGNKAKTFAPRVTELLGLCYMGCILLRLPVSFGEMFDWVDKDEIIYLRVTRQIPQDMLSRLPPYFTSALETRVRLRPDDLYITVLEQIIAFRDGPNKLIFPPLNAPLLMFKHIRNLALPLDVYAGARNLAKVLDIDFSYPQQRRYQWSAHPEAQVVALIVIATKLSQPLDNVRRTPRNITDPTILTVDWPVWQDTFKDQGSEGLRRGKEIDLTSDDVMNMNQRQMDEYLEFFEELFPIDPEPKLPTAILEMFPLLERPIRQQHPNDTNEVAAADHLERVMRTLHYEKPVKPRANEETNQLLRPGMKYVHYRSVEELSPIAKVFFDRAAKCAGLSLETLRLVVFQMEMKLKRYIDVTKREARKRMLEEQDGALDDDSNVRRAEDENEDEDEHEHEDEGGDEDDKMREAPVVSGTNDNMDVDMDQDSEDMIMNQLNY